MKYEKAITKLREFNSLEKEKKIKLLKKILTDPDMLKFQFNFGQDKTSYSDDMLNNLYNAMAMPGPMKAYEYMYEYYGRNEFTRSSAVALSNVLAASVRARNDMAEYYSQEASNGINAETKDMKARLNKYSEHMETLRDIIQKMLKPAIKNLSSETNISKEMLYRALILVPEAKYIPQNKITMVCTGVLTELYAEANKTGFPGLGYGVKWKPLFKSLFGEENIPSVAIAILLEGAHHIDKYRESENLAYVKDCWDSLTKFALNELNKAPDKVRSQMIEIYLKKAENMINKRNGRPTDLRVNLTRLPNEFSNLVNTVGFYKKQFDSISSRVRYATGKNNREAPQAPQLPVSTTVSSTPTELKKDPVDKVIDAAKTVADTITDLTSNE